MRLMLRIVERLRAIIPAELPLFARISATDWVEDGWDIEQSVVLCKRLKEIGVDLIDVSSGGNVLDARIPVAKGYQALRPADSRRGGKPHRGCRANQRPRIRG